MASRISTIFCLLLISYSITSVEGGSLKLSLGFTSLSPPEVVILKNHPLLLNCSGFTEEGELEISWNFQDSEIKDKHFVVFKNGSLYAEKLPSQKKKEKRWEGNYTCLLHNRFGTLVSRPIKVVFARMSKAFTSQPLSLSVKEGGNARFSCQINAVPPANIFWYKDGIELPQNNSRYTILHNGILQINNVLLNDAGIYKCLCENVARQKESDEAFLTVESREENFQPPVFLNPPEDVVAISNNSALLECIADGFPVVEFSWKREDEKPLPKHLLKNNNLYIPQVQLNDQGSYICSATVVNKETNQMAVAVQKSSLNIHVPPKFLKVPQNHIIPTAQTVRFECEVDGIPAASTKWLKNGAQIYINGRIKLKAGNTLIVSQTTTSDSGIYQCVASNSAGVSVASARLQVNASAYQPRPPSNLRAVTVSSNAILLLWDAVPSKPGAHIQAYTVHYVPSKGGSEQDAVAVNTSLKIERLKPFTNYTFYVRAYSNKSASEPSQSIVQMTGEDVPLVAPKIKLNSISPTTLHVQWNELSLEKARGIITGHRIYYRKHKQASSSVKTINAVTEYTITGLIPKQKYDVRVLSGTKAGFPLLSDAAWPWQTFEMPSSSNSKILYTPILHLTVINNTALEVKWSMPSNNSYPITGYHLSYRQQNKPLQSRITLPANTTKYLLTDLAPQSWYEVYLVAYNKNGESIEAVRNIMTISGDNPNIETFEVVEPPHQLEAEPLTSSSIHLTWRTPETSRNISYYTIRYHPVFPNGLVNESYVYYMRSTNNEVVIMDLQPHTLYEFSVRSHDVENRQGPFSLAIECRTNEALPSAPQDITWAPIDANLIRLNWQAPKFPNGIITSYYILYSTKNDNKIASWKIKEEKGTELTSLLTGLASNTLYYLRMRAKNAAGLSLPTPVERINIPVRNNNTKPPSPEPIEAEPSNHILGIIIGVSIGIVFIIIIIVAIIWRNKCCSSNPDPAVEDRSSSCCGNGYIPHLNGHILSHASNRRSHIETQEMESFTPTNTYPNGSHQPHLDTKGGYPTKLCNGRANGLIPQHTKTSSVKKIHDDQPVIVEATSSSKQPMRYSSRDLEIPESGWRNEDDDVTSATVLLKKADPATEESSSAAEDCSNSGTPRQWKENNNSSAFSLTNGAKTEANESSCNIKPCQKLVPSTDPSCTVPLPPNPPPSDCCLLSMEAADQNNVPSIDSAERGAARSNNKDSGANADEQSSLPFSVNAFLSPLAGPRFYQSSNPNSAPEPT